MFFADLILFCVGWIIVCFLAAIASLGVAAVFWVLVAALSYIMEKINGRRKGWC